jgi:para-nitrobenzyl esterase
MTPSSPVVQTTAGLIRGQFENGLSVFRGVPYAQPPVGALRWLPAEPLAEWDGVLDATSDGYLCPQPTVGPVPALMGYEIREQDMSEDCLTVSVWTPAVDSRRRPVLIWIHGGGFLTGAASLPLYSGAALAARGDVVVVGINYRIGPFGYLDCNPDDPSGGNRGLTDQALALKWVHENVTAFGGDSDNICVAGQSGGAWSILALLSLAKPPTIKRAILQSPPLGLPLRTAEQESLLLSRYVKALGAVDTAELRDLTSAELLAPLPQMARQVAQWGRYTPLFQPHADGKFLSAKVFDDIADRSPETEIVIGWTSREFSFFFGEAVIDDSSADRLVERMASAFGNNAADAHARYVQDCGTESVREVLIEYCGDEMFRIPGIELAEMLAARERTIYAYEFGMKLVGRGAPYSGAHCLEIPYVMGTLKESRDGGAVLTSSTPHGYAQRVTDAVQTAWLGFIHHGNPAVGEASGWRRFKLGDPQGLLFCEADTITAATPTMLMTRRQIWTDLAQCS